MKVYISHGKESGPWSTKIKRLAAAAIDHGCDVDSIDYTDTFDPDLRAERLLKILEQEQEEFVLVGSSMGGYVSLVVSGKVSASGVFLLAPALYKPGYRIQEYPTEQNNLEIVHGWSDEVIPPKNSIKFSKSAHCSLHLIDGDHRLEGSIDNVLTIFEQFLLKVINKEL